MNNLVMNNLVSNHLAACWAAKRFTIGSMAVHYAPGLSNIPVCGTLDNVSSTAVYDRVTCPDCQDKVRADTAAKGIVDPEAEAICRIVAILRPMPEEVRQRIVRYLDYRF